MAFGAGPGANGDRLARNGRLSCLLLLGRKCARRLGIPSGFRAAVPVYPSSPQHWLDLRRRWCRVCVQRGAREPVENCQGKA
jgi:hypothetical protein